MGFGEVNEVSFVVDFVKYVFLSFSYGSVTPADAMKWIATEPMLDPPVEGSEFDFETIDKLKPWMAPGLFQEMSFSGTRVKIQKTQHYVLHQSFVDASGRHVGEATIAADGALENYSAGKPFSHEQIMEADADVAGYMVGWNRVKRWQRYGWKAVGPTVMYLGSTPWVRPT